MKDYPTQFLNIPMDDAIKSLDGGVLVDWINDCVNMVVHNKRSIDWIGEGINDLQQNVLIALWKANPTFTSGGEAHSYISTTTLNNFQEIQRVQAPVKTNYYMEVEDVSQMRVGIEDVERTLEAPKDVDESQLVRCDLNSLNCWQKSTLNYSRW